ncbi:hypothetical protein TBLA_0F03680 [Henningerozyma blattae CBS 6284]|uniref:HTH CENPB-type domain-containing protein n=1 Tax=Henningerozyma blattae (strain ATCC 34711 / CBS 6284 / DSM 70876 / NBRC 10599 / NRRL Y-10934 / UCD 77-7) TaxID=1071380 RepID=I2H6A3_HENB6|nr:hypothetical protein TBLA_0F03680 [Tetrapisispora blattae CBS 6284]CCH61905.1 hypothetical protein TBLA_0F03680 [Tetrapisispora blattae CBS 6284]
MLSIEQRYNICLMAERHPKWKQLELAKWAYETFQLPSIPSQGTISRVLAKQDVYMNCKDHERESNIIRKQNNILVRRVLREWVNQSIWNGIPITSLIIQHTAQAIWHRIPSEFREHNGSFSHRWINTFLSKMGINPNNLDNELPKTPKIWTFEDRYILKEFFAKVPQQDLFTLDETFLAYNLPLDYAQYETNCIQRKIEVLTVMLCCNLDGSEKLPPLVIGKYNNYKSFKNFFRKNNNTSNNNNTNNKNGNEKLCSSTNLNSNSTSQNNALLGEQLASKFNIKYQSNRKAWLTSSIFHDWLVRWDKRLVADNRKIWIVLDDSCSHRIVNLSLKNIRMVYTSSNSKFLPFNWGVLDDFKTCYRIQQYQALIELQNRLERRTGKKFLISFEQSQLTMANAFKFIKKSWDSISPERIKANWKSSSILPFELIKITNDKEISMAFKKNTHLELQLNDLCRNYYCVKHWEYDLLLDLNIENKNTNFLSTDELIESAIIDMNEPGFNSPTENSGANIPSNSSSTNNLVNMITNSSSNEKPNDIKTNKNINLESSIVPSNELSVDIKNSPNDNASTVSTINPLPINNNVQSIPTVKPESDSNNFTNQLDLNSTPKLEVTNLDGLLNGDFTQEALDRIFTVSALIDGPNVCLDKDGEFDLKNVGLSSSIPPSDFFTEVFTPNLDGQLESTTNTTQNSNPNSSSPAGSHAQSLTHSNLSPPLSQDKIISRNTTPMTAVAASSTTNTIPLTTSMSQNLSSNLGNPLSQFPTPNVNINGMSTTPGSASSVQTNHSTNSNSNRPPPLQNINQQPILQTTGPTNNNIIPPNNLTNISENSNAGNSTNFLPNLNNLSIPELDQILQSSDFPSTTTESNNMINNAPNTGSVNNHTINNNIGSSNAASQFPDPSRINIQNNIIPTSTTDSNINILNNEILTNNNQNDTASYLGCQINIANTLGSVLQHLSANDILFSDATINELRTQYINVLEKIEKIKQQFNNQKVRRGQVYLESLLATATTDGIDKNILNITDKSNLNWLNPSLTQNNIPNSNTTSNPSIVTPDMVNPAYTANAKMSTSSQSPGYRNDSNPTIRGLNNSNTNNSIDSNPYGRSNSNPPYL